MAKFARLVKELRQLHPAELHQLFQGSRPIPAAKAVASVADAWASDVNSLDEQRAALRRMQAEVAQEKAAVQQLSWVWRA